MRRRVRQVQTTSILNKRFNRAVDIAKHASFRRIHPLHVISDLRRGNLDSLNLYLLQEKGIADREVAIELRKLLSGSPSRTPFRMICIEHPDGKKRIGGRPDGRGPPTKRKREVVTAVREIAIKGKVEAAVQEVADTMQIKVSTVYKHLREMIEYEQAEKLRGALELHREQEAKANRNQIRASMKRRDAALSKLRRNPRS